MPLRADLERALADLDREGLRRTPRVVERVRGPLVTVDGRDVVSFASNDYLGISGDPRLAEAAVRAAAEFGWGAGSSRLLGGTTRAHTALEERFASWKREESALVFTSGYAANVGLLTAIADRDTLIVSDERNHASLIDGCRLTRAQVRKYLHGEPLAAARALKAPALRKILVTDSVFSVDGDVAPLNDLAAVAEGAGATLVVDDAHGLGVLGQEGRGALEAAGLEGRGIVQTANLAKAAGASGGVVTGSKALRDLLTSTSRAFIFTTAPPAAAAAAALAGLETMISAHGARARLRSNMQHLRARLAMPGVTPIVPFPLGGNERALQASARLWELGFLVPAVRPPTVPRGKARLRISITALHTTGQLDALADALGKV